MAVERNPDGRRVPLLGIAVALFGLPVGGALMDAVPPATASVYNWALVGVVVGFVLAVENRPLSSIGVRRPRPRDVLLGVGVFVAGLASMILAVRIVGWLGLGAGPIEGGAGGSTGLGPLLITIFVGVTAGVTEEVLYRGYAFERVEEVTRSTWVAGLLTAVVFVLIHFETHGVGGMVIISPVAAILTLAYVRRRTLFVPVLGHVLVNSFWDLVALLGRLLGAG